MTILTTAAGDEMCDHDRDPENMLRQLVLAAMNDPERLGDLLDCADCPDCARRVMEKFAFTFGGWIQDTIDQPADDPLACTCEHPLPAEAKALRIVLAYNAIGFSDDGSTLRKAVEDAAKCPACTRDVHVAAARFHVNLLNSTHVSWHPDDKIGGLEEHYLEMLDGQR